MSPFLGAASMQRRQCVSSGPITGNFWSIRLIPEQGIHGGADCPEARRGSAKKPQSIGRTARRLVRLIFPPFDIHMALGKIYPHSCVGKIVTAAAEHELHTTMFSAWIVFPFTEQPQTSDRKLLRARARGFCRSGITLEFFSKSAAQFRISQGKFCCLADVGRRQG